MNRADDAGLHPVHNIASFVDALHRCRSQLSIRYFFFRIQSQTTKRIIDLFWI